MRNVKHDYDFALLKLDKAVPLNRCIGTACLPSENRCGEAGDIERERERERV